MSWRDELKTQLAAVGRGETRVPATIDDDTHSRAILQDVMRVAAKVLRFASQQMTPAKYAASTDYGDDVLRLTLEDCQLEIRLIVNGLAINVRRETGVVDLLHVRQGTMVDSKNNRVSSMEGYFGGLVVDLAAAPEC